ncbi:MAG: hypothetical protein HQK50_06085 [Oligoflexia bacterium]|nr:hypothetical protein [Oligoflexia bacterium]
MNNHLLKSVTEQIFTLNSKAKDLESLLEEGGDFLELPITHLYLGIKSKPSELVAQILPKLSSEQRQLLLDIDLWKKDNLDPMQFSSWIHIYSETSLELQREFLTSPLFLLLLKSVAEVWTFDQEEPEYPEHSNFFVTEDNRLLIELTALESCSDADDSIYELQGLIKNLYAEVGVDEAYTLLFKAMSDVRSEMLEEEYRFKKSRLEDVGVIDYYDALAIETPLLSWRDLKKFIKARRLQYFKLNENQLSLMLPPQESVVLFSHAKSDLLWELMQEVEKVTSPHRQDFLQFNFIRMINANISYHQAIKEGSIALDRVGQECLQRLLLGFTYLRYLATLPTSGISDKALLSREGVFAVYDFVDSYKIGKSLMAIAQKEMKAALAKTAMHQEDAEEFVGDYWKNFLDEAFTYPLQYDQELINSWELYSEWYRQCELLIGLLPYIDSFYKAFKELKSGGRVHDIFYKNYTVESIDFTAIILSSFANFVLGHYQDDTTKGSNKMGLSESEFFSFVEKILQEGTLSLKPREHGEIESMLQAFAEAFAFKDLVGFKDYLYLLLKNDLEGYQFSTLTSEELEHVGGPIILQQHDSQTAQSSFLDKSSELKLF